MIVGFLNVAEKINIRIEDITSHSIVPYTIYDKNGKILCRKGEILNAKLLSYLSLYDLFKLDFDESAGVGKIISRISRETTDFVINQTREYLEAAEKNQKAPIQGFIDTRDKIFTEVMEHIDEIQHVGELRIYAEDYNLSHGVNVCSLATAIAIKLGYEKEELKELALGGLLHDVGKTKIPKQVLNKPCKLTKKEFELVKLHAPLGYKLIKDEYSFSNTVALVALDHHERYDGSGYARSLIGDRISRYAQIITLADIYDAASSNKVYAAGKTAKEIIKELLKTSPTFNPRILYTLVHMVDYNTGDLKEELNIKTTK